MDSRRPAPTNAKVLILSLATGLLLIAPNSDENILDILTATAIRGNIATTAANNLTLIISVSIKHLSERCKIEAQRCKPEKMRQPFQIVSSLRIQQLV